MEGAVGGLVGAVVCVLVYALVICGIWHATPNYPAFILYGVLGSVIGEIVCKLFRIQEPIAKGLALGTAAHAIGTSKAMEMGPVEGAMSSLAIAVAGLLTVVSASVFAQFM